ncbi:MAG: DUF3987 domain-containing protein [Ruminococcus sp.]
MQVNIHYSNAYQNAKNCLYKNHGTAENAEEFKKLVAYDHVFFEFKDDYRAIKNFLGTSVAALDCDNDHSENKDDWITLRKLTEYFPDVRFIVYTSRNYMKPKGSKAPRPRFHILFPIERITSADEYVALLKRLQKYLPVFDEKALDAGRFYFGNKEAKVYFHEGEFSITDTLDEADLWDSEPFFKLSDNTVEDSDNNATQPNLGEIIPEGSRNYTLSRTAGKILKRYGKTKRAAEEFKKATSRCSPPLDSKEIESIWISAQKFYDKISASKDYVPPDEYEKNFSTRRSSNSTNEQTSQEADSAAGAPRWDKPVPFEEPNLPTFPVHTLPDTVRDYVTALAESTQIPVDMCACSVLAALALCIQGKFKIQGKPDWIEPLNLYVVSIAEPSERKSAIISAVSKPITAYEAEENERRAPEIERSKMEKRILENEQRRLENQAAKNKEKVDSDKLTEIADEIANFKVKQPLKLYVDDITTEKLTSALNESGRTAVLSSEAGIFNMLSGLYSKDVNIDVFLKAYSGDTIRVDRIGRPSESIMEPALTVLLTVQPSVISGIMNNRTFRGRGLTARFLYCLPRSLVGTRRFNSAPVPNRVKYSYWNIIKDLLDEYKVKAEIITLSYEALKLLEEFAEELEPKLRGEYADISDWAGKLVGTVLRFAGILTRASIFRCAEIEFDDSSPEDEDTPETEFTYLDTQPLVVSADTMQNAITLGSYFIQHAKAAYDLMGADEITEDAKYILNAVTKRRLDSFTRRDVMRMCQKFRKAADIQPALDMLTDRGFLWEEVPESTGFKKPKGSTYLVNPMLYEDE